MEQKPEIKQPVPVDVSKKKNPFASFKAWYASKTPKEKTAIFAGVSLGILLAGTFLIYAFGPKGADPDPEPEVVSTYVAPPEPVYSPLTGIEVTQEQADRPVTAVMIENSIDARPQSGLEEAGMVFEAIAEGGITRFMAVYQEARPGNIGPIRSARPYYVEWAKGLDASYLHSGGSGEALALIQTLGVKDLDHGRYSSRVADRVSNRFAPHNVYSNFDKIDGINNELGNTSSSFTAFARKDPTPPTVEAPATASAISFNISGANYNTSYTYRPETGDYARVMAGVPHTDQESGKQITPEVVVALITTYGIHPNRIHSVYGTTGSGEALVFQDGVLTNATWRKTSQSASLELLAADGSQLELNPGQTWITPIQPGRVTYTP